MERRAARRLGARWLARARRDERDVADGKLENISATGILFLSPTRFRRGERVALDVRVGAKCFFRCEVEIVREAHRAGSYWALGARIISLSALDGEILQDSLARITPSRYPGARRPLLIAEG